MQNDAISAPIASTTTTANSSTPPLLSLQDHHHEGDFVLTSPMYSSAFSPKPSSYTDQYSLYDSRLLMQHHQDMVNRHNLCHTRLREATDELDSLRLENAALRSVNRDLNKHLSLLIQASVQKHFNTINNHNNNNTTPFEVADLFHGMSLGTGDEELVSCDQEESPTSVIESGSSGSASSVMDAERVSLPKSISVRSNGYLKMGQVGGGDKTRTQSTSQLVRKQKVYVRGSKKEEEPLELEVYNQGMFKTELCNKWQETGTCPYGDHCQFAHGIGELRPVIRHPRYKTEVCRMILAGDICPYGHRCHFRHALTDQERFMGHIKPRPIKLN